MWTEVLVLSVFLSSPSLRWKNPGDQSGPGCYLFLFKRWSLWKPRMNCLPKVIVKFKTKTHSDSFPLFSLCKKKNSSRKYKWQELLVTNPGLWGRVWAMIQWLCCLSVSMKLPVPSVTFDTLAVAPGPNAVLESTFLRRASNLSSFGYHGYGTACYQSSDLHCKPSLETRTVGLGIQVWGLQYTETAIGKFQGS